MKFAKSPAYNSWLSHDVTVNNNLLIGAFKRENYESNFFDGTGCITFEGTYDLIKSKVEI